MKKRILLFTSIIMIITFMFSFLVHEAFAEDVQIISVSTESELVTAITSGGYIQLSNNIDISSELIVKTEVTLDLNGYMLRQTAKKTIINGINLNGKTFTINDSRPNENIHYFIAHEDKAWEYVETPEEGVEYEIITGGIITGANNITNVTSGGGGAIRLNDITDYVVINGGTIVGNYAARAGGASYGGTVTMNNGRICGNAAGKFAGAIALSGNFTMNDGIIEKNYSPSGTNEYKFNITDISIGSSSNFTVNGGIIKANIATVTSSSKTTLTVSNNANIIGNIYLQNGIKANITGGSIIGRIRMTKGSFTMSGGEISGGIADNSEINYFGNNGGGVSVEGGNFTMTGGTIHNNQALENGGGVYVNGGTFIMDGGNIYVNDATNGGAVFVNSGNATITSGNIGIIDNGNIASSNGGGIYVAGGNVTIEGGNVSYNNAGKNGGGIYLEGGTFNMSDGNINYNNAINGAGAYITTANFNLTGGEFNNNIALLNGGGFYVGDDSVVNLSNGEVKYNKATNGGGFYQTQSENQTTTELTGNCIVKNNESQNGNGGGVYINGGSTFRMVGGKITYNQSTITSRETVTAKESSGGVGGGVYILNGTFTMYDSEGIAGNAAIFGNEADYAADDLFASGENTSFDAISVVDMAKADEYKTADSWFEDFPLNESHTTLNYEHRNDEDSSNDIIISPGRYKSIQNIDDMNIASTVLYRNCNDYIAITMGNSVGKIRISVLDEDVISSHSFIYKIESCSTDECNDENPEMKLEVLVQKNKEAIVVSLASGKYKVSIIPNWSWRYDETTFTITENHIQKQPVLSNSINVNIYTDQYTDVATSYKITNKNWLSTTKIINS